MTLSPRWAYLAKRKPCGCHTTAERCTCAAECLTHGEFPRKPATNPNVWPAPDPMTGVIISGMRDGVITSANGHPIYCRIGMKAYRPSERLTIWPGPPDPSAPREPREGR